MAAALEMHRAKGALRGLRAPCRLPPPRLRLGGSPRQRAGGGASQQMVRAGCLLLVRPALASGAGKGGRAGAAQWRLRGGSVAPTAQLARLPPGCRDHLRSGSLIAPHGSSTCECPPGRAASGAASARSLPGPGSAPAAGQEALRARGPEGAAAARALGREPELPHPSV